MPSIRNIPTSSTTPITLLRCLPDTLAGPVRLRRRRNLLPDWAPATGHLRGTALIIYSARSPTTVLLAVDVHAVSFSHNPAFSSVVVRSSHPGLHARLRIFQQRREWVATLSALAAATPPRLTDFKVISPIGKGGGGTVFLVREKAAKVTIPLAMKVVQKHDAFYSDGSLRHAVDERLVLGLVKEFPFVITLTHAFQTDTALYMVSHFCPGGDLRTMLKRQRHGRMPEQRARGIMAQLVLALEHLHSLNVIYRDVKPGNVLLSADGDVRLCDFGLSKVITGGRSGRTKSFCGSTAYMSPQIINARSYGIATDMWSLGALFFTMLVGRTPFEKASAAMAADNDVAHIEKRIVTEEPKYPSFLSKPATDMIAGLLRKNEEERTKMKDLKKSMFFVGVDWTAILEEGYERAAKPAEALAHRDLENFDCKRLISHGIALQDEELDKEVVRSDMLGERERVQRRRGSLLGRVGFSQGFVRRQASALVSKGSLRRDGVARRNSSSIIGFGYSRKSDFGVNGTDSETDRSRGGVQLV